MPQAPTKPRTFPVDKSGHTLRGDVAAAYFRAIAAGMPTGGVDVFQRTWADQQALYNRYLHGGTIAARPSWHAPHIDQRAMDFHTGSGGKYDPSPAFVWATKGGIGKDKPHAGEKLQITPFGFRRSVPSERWHLEYDRDLDKHRAADLTARLKALGISSVKAFQKSAGLDQDGVDGPMTWAALLGAEVPAVTPTPVPDPTPEPVGAIGIRAASYNAQLQHFGGGSYSADAAFVDSTLRPSVLAAQEVDEAARNSICAATGFKVYPLNTVGIFFDPAKYTWGGRIEVDLGTPYHGMIGTQLTSLRNGQTFVAASVHIRPRDAFGSDAKAKAGKQADVAKVIAILRLFPRVVVGGDWSSNARAQMEAAGYQLVTPYVDTYDEAGIQHIDGIYARGLTDRTGGSEHPTGSSDHDGLVANLTLPAPIPTN
jgi:hypothetical protein